MNNLKKILLSFLCVLGMSIKINFEYSSFYFSGNSVFFVVLFVSLILLSLKFKYINTKNNNVLYKVLFFVSTFIGLLVFKKFPLLSINNFMVFAIVIFSYNYVFYLFLNIFLHITNKTRRKAIFKLINNNFCNKRIVTISFILSICFSLSSIIGEMIASNNSVLNFFQISSIFLFVIYSFILMIFFVFIFNLIINFKEKDSDFLYKNRKPIFYIAFICIMLIYTFYYLKHFPGVFSQDSFYSISQSLGYYRFSDGHPVSFTLILKLFTMISSDIKFDMILYCVSQMIALAITFSFVIKYLIIKKINSFIIICSFLFFAFSPINAMYSFTVWKDIPFSISVILYLITILEIISNPKDFLKKPGNMIIFGLLILFVSIFRNNGIYMMVLSFPFIILLLKSIRKKLLIIFFISFITYGLIKGPLYTYLNVEKGPIREALSIPIQQIARTFSYEYENISEKDKQTVDKFLDAENIGKLYDPRISDPVKSTWKDINFSKEKGNFFNVWYKLFKKHSIIYIDSFLSNSYGYWYPPTVYWTVYTNNATEAYWLYRPEYNLETNPIIKGKSIVSDVMLDIRNIPVLSMTHSIGYSFWIMFFLMAGIIVMKKYKLLIPFIMMTVLWLTLIASPVYAEFRYSYSLFVSLPLLWAVAINSNKFLQSDNYKEQKNEKSNNNYSRIQ